MRPGPDFRSNQGDLEIVRDSPPTPAPEAPFATDQEAEQFLRAWLCEKFGPLPADTGLQVTSVQRSASGHDKPQYDWDAGHTFVFMQTWRNVVTDRSALLYLQGRSKVSGTVSLARITSIAGSDRKILDEAAARAQFAAVLRSMGRDTAEAASCPMRLQFIWDDGDEKTCELRPVWGIGEGPGYLDAVTGALGRDG